LPQKAPSKRIDPEGVEDNRNAEPRASGRYACRRRWILAWAGVVSARQAGLLFHPTSLPGRFGIGDLGPEAERFLDWAAAAGQTIWQVLPLGPPGPQQSPYDGISAFAGHVLLISPERLVEEGLLPAAALGGSPETAGAAVDFAAVVPWKNGLLRQSWELFKTAPPTGASEALERFVGASEQRPWLEDWALFSAIRKRFGGVPWPLWDKDLAARSPSALIAARRELSEEIAFERYTQFLFFSQWNHLHAEGRRRGISIMGDIPIYLSLDSADVWAHRSLFSLDDDGRPELVAGVPPDYFSATGQLWGNPLYRWDRLEQEGFSWWIDRLRAALHMVDIVRLDHFRGFSAYWAVPASAETAVDGAWIPGPGERFFSAIRSALGSMPIVAEDLGLITPDVRRLRDLFGLPGMKVLQFAFGEDDSPDLPHRHLGNAVVYTGTHDNDTTRGWFAGLPEADRARLFDYLGPDSEPVEWKLIRAAYASVADRAIVPMQDLLGLDSQARMNTPGRSKGNWAWRARANQFGPELAARLRRLASLTGRLPGTGQG
jgi:4-alpha-glucanotransferase